MNSIAATVRSISSHHGDTLSTLLALAPSRLRDYTAIAKPRIALMVLLTVGVGFALGSQGSFDLIRFIHAALGILMAATASSALNQYLERRSDGRMERTRDRPLPTGRIRPLEILLLGLGLTLFSTVYLVVTVNLLTALLTLFSVALYAGVYTPLKTKTPCCTAVGAIPGALPPVLGWTATGGGTSLDATAFALFAIVYLWQFPHFLAIAWLYRDDYAAAGLKMLPAGGRRKVTGWVALGYALCLIPIGLIPTLAGSAGESAAVMTVLLGLVYAGAALQFLWQETTRSARALLWTSLVYLPTVLLSITLGHYRGLI